MDLNKAFIIGRVTGDVQLKSTSTNQSVANFSIATNRVWKDKAGQKKESAEFHNIVAWGRQAEIASQFLTKGGLVMVEGRLQTRSWQGNDGQARKTTEIVCEMLQLGPKSANSGYKKPSSDVQGQDFGSTDVDDGNKTDETSSFKDSLGSGIEEVSVDDGGDEIKPEDLPF